jgi:hypothetical protein
MKGEAMMNRCLAVLITVSLFLVPGALAGCAKERPLPEDAHEHTIAGFLLLAGEQEVYRQFEGVGDGPIQLAVGEELEGKVTFLDSEGEEVTLDHDHEASVDQDTAAPAAAEVDHEHPFTLFFAGFDPAILRIEPHHHEPAVEPRSGQEEETDGMGFAALGLHAGQSAFSLWLLEENEILFSSWPALVDVEGAAP